ncbi:restriction endonuclease [Synechococcus sp. Tobar12-5m-g]|uniref:restriction endonuclease n=1 Tax=unclassified Synechococcus TaxID=2626047 RepID=UPI0020CEE2E1|nr:MULTISPECIES: restriction endonuclease [unclassified Synechococcus]MCP9771672.1 restriction endonuclease [Synechococcus sp. Tobar12-5m-g]MCP9872613.1 restriction endonuclease [Synechococcus sp. Cruz CV-v-12]
MTLWLIRSGSRGEHEQKFLDEGRSYVAWDGLDVDLACLTERQELIAALAERYPEEKPKALINWSAQVWAFGRDIAEGDWVVMPSKLQSGIYFGEITSGYHYNPLGPNPYFHWRSVNWFSGLIPRSAFPQDLLFSFGAFLTICRIQRNDAEARVRAMAANNWRPETAGANTASVPLPGQGEPISDATEAGRINLEELVADQVERQIEARFKGHGLTVLVEAILQAEGYSTYRSPEGADGGADILAGGGEMGFGNPSICVEVKSGDGPVDRPTVDKLIGAGQKFGAESCLFVSWSGFKPNVQKELARDFFRVRLWSRKDLLEKLFTHYGRLPEEIRLALPLKRVWMVANQSD